jgi:hypothetical protein
MIEGAEDFEAGAVPSGGDDEEERPLPRSARFGTAWQGVRGFFPDCINEALGDYGGVTPAIREDQA